MWLVLDQGDIICSQAYASFHQLCFCYISVIYCYILLCTCYTPLISIIPLSIILLFFNFASFHQPTIQRIVLRRIRLGIFPAKVLLQETLLFFKRTTLPTTFLTLFLHQTAWTKQETHNILQIRVNHDFFKKISIHQQ